MGQNTCGNITGTSIEIPDGCGKLTKNGLKNNWLVVRKILEWIKGFFTFSIPGEQDAFIFETTATGSVIIPTQSLFYPDNPTYIYPTDSTQYAYFDVFWNGVMYQGGDSNGRNAYNQAMAWSLDLVGPDYVMSFYDVNDAPRTLDTPELPGQLVVKFRPSNMVGSKFCTTNGSANPADEPCVC